MTMARDAVTQPEIPPLHKARFPLIKRAAEFGVSYRCIHDEDTPFLMALYRSTREVELNRTPWSEAEKQAFVTMQFEAQHQHYQAHYPAALWLIIQIEEAPVGRLYLERWQKEHRIIDITLSPLARGFGIGGGILEDLMTEAAALQKAVSIHVEKENPAMKLYRRLGFEKQEDKGVYDLLIWSANP
ncbi:GNAT family N-acetyltransferase [Phaeobacter sp. B1627]|uniref:GNAT family N-acetyltransferase n=1 Tax=Phaeobacter sp. B1627 TaxID=2583809 RepID=UPI00111969E4|nr:GNAT family N-acetyltransferase [Phaeobacter sp. B1627]TNJ39616.1 GNAT family N-acetyltransferase [Phaeobacter sp. B1627]